MQPADQTLENQFLEALRGMGGRAGNMALRNKLGWKGEQYWKVRNTLQDLNRVGVGRGRGGSVFLIEQRPEEGDAQPEGNNLQNDEGRVNERKLYEPVKTVIKQELVYDLRFPEDCIVEITAQQGRRNTGGIWSRPDIVIVTVQRLPHIQRKIMDLITFEIKAQENIDITAVYEALAHRRAATQAYVWLHVRTEEGEDHLLEVLERIEEEAGRHGVGMIVGAKPDDYATWDVKLRAVRYEPDPQAMDEFIAKQLSADARQRLGILLL